MPPDPVLTGTTSQTITVDYATTAGGSATPNADYTPVSGTLTFDLGVDEQAFRVPILDDVLTRMAAHQSKKSPRLRPLRAWWPLKATLAPRRT